VRDMPRAQQLIEDGADLFGHSSTVAAVAAQARQDELAAMDAARRDVMQSYPQGDLGDQWPGEPEPDYLDDEEWPHDEPLAEED
jgi:hypothetical protein